ncbi:hypothetical protein C0991_012463 [Blastosporella zonata]|nr:hypothetical protein C0991_012463 [Blastosporella zonata]
MDVLQMDVGLSNLDPRELANGSLEELRDTLDSDPEVDPPSRSSAAKMYTRSAITSQADTTASLIALRQSTARTLALYQERARLLEEMARLQNPVEDTL